MSGIWKNNTLDFIDNYVKTETALEDKRKIQSVDHYFKTIAKKENRFITQNDFSLSLETIFPEELLVFTQEQKEELDKYVDDIESYQQFCIYHQLLAKVLADYENADDLMNPIAQTVLKTYEYMKLKLKQKYPQIHALYLKRITSFQLKSEQKQNRPNCPECNSVHVLSSGINWLCRTCGRQFRKSKRK